MSEENGAAQFHPGLRLKALRLSRALSQRELAKRADMTHGSLSQIEQGKVSPTLSTLEKVLGVLDTPLESFFSDRFHVCPSFFDRDAFIISPASQLLKILPLTREPSHSETLGILRLEQNDLFDLQSFCAQGHALVWILEGNLEYLGEGKDQRLMTDSGMSIKISGKQRLLNKDKNAAQALIMFRESRR